MHSQHARLFIRVMVPTAFTEVAFLCSIAATPEDDAPSLTYADYLDKHGEQARAAIIRRMVAMPSYIFYWSRRWKHPKHIHAVSRRAIRGLLGQVWPMCAREWEPWPEVEEVVIRRGFVESITIRSTDFLRFAIEFFPFHPIQDVLMWGHSSRVHS